MLEHLPPLKSLLAFSAASRSINFSQAAEHLCITQSAISHQIKSLETFLGVKLFNREGKKLTLTEEGQILAKVVNLGLDEIALTSKQLMGKLEPSLQFGVSSSFAIHRVTPELTQLNERHPSLDLRLRMLSCSDDIPALGLDVFLYDKPIEHISYECEALKQEDYIAVATPEIAKKAETVPIDQWHRHTKFIDLQGLNTWHLWGERLELSISEEDMLYFSHTILMMQSVLSHQGVALLGETMVKPELVKGQLVRLHPHSMQFEQDGFYFHWHKRRKNDKNIRVLKNWLYGLMK